jgi:hypothetical protein
VLVIPRVELLKPRFWRVGFYRYARSNVLALAFVQLRWVKP